MRILSIVKKSTMKNEHEMSLKGWRRLKENSLLGRLFLDKKFFHYTWIGIFVSILNIIALWLFIDVLGISTIIAGVLVVGLTFILRYLLFIFFKIL